MFKTAAVVGAAGSGQRGIGNDASWPKFKQTMLAQMQSCPKYGSNWTPAHMKYAQEAPKTIAISPC
jgi:hypothetical protein